MIASPTPSSKVPNVSSVEHTPGPNHPLVEHWDDEISIGNGVIVTLIPGQFFYDDCGVMGFDTVREARDAVRAIVKKARGDAA